MSPSHSPISGEHLTLAKRLAEIKHRNLRQAGIFHVTLDDLIGAAYLGLAKASAKYEHSKDNKDSFSKFATFYIIYEINGYLRSLDLLDHRIRKAINDLKTAEAELTQTLQRKPSDFELAKHQKISIEELRELRAKEVVLVSLESQNRVDDDSEISIIEPPSIGLTPEEELMQKEVARDVNDCLNNALDANEKAILISRFWKGLKLKDIGIGTNKAHRTEQKAKLKMKLCMESKGWSITDLMAISPDPEND